METRQVPDLICGSKSTDAFRQSVGSGVSFSQWNSKENLVPVTTTSQNIEGVFSSLKTVAFAGAVISVVTSLTCYLDAEYRNYSDFETEASAGLRVILILLCLIQVTLVLKYHMYRVKLMHLQELVLAPSPWEALWKLNNVRWVLLIEVLVCSVFVPVDVEEARKYYQITTYDVLTLEDILLPVVFLRLYHVFRWLYHCSSLSSHRANFYMCVSDRTIHNIDKSLPWVLKTYGKNNPFLTAAVLSFFIFIISSLIFRTYERSVPESDFTMWNTFWLSAVSEYTIGYGDYTPNTHVGRLCCVALAFFGVLTMSNMVMNFQSLCKPTFRQVQFILAVQNKFAFEKRDRHMAAVLIQRRWQLHVKRIHGINSLHEMLRYTAYVLRYRRIRSTQTLSLSRDLYFEELIQQFTSQLDSRDANSRVKTDIVKVYCKDVVALATAEFSILRKAEKLKRIFVRLSGTGLVEESPRPTLNRSFTLSSQTSAKVRLKQRGNTVMRKLRMRRHGFRSGNIDSSFVDPGT